MRKKMNMGGLFGKSKKPGGGDSSCAAPSRVTEQDKAVLQLKQQRDKLRQYQRKITSQLGKEREVARNLLKNGKKEKALLLLRKKRYQEQMLEKTDHQIENMERMVSDIEFAQLEVQVVAGLEQGNTALRKLHEIVSLDRVERIMEETEEGIAYQQEIDNLLSGSLTDQDEEDVLAELDRLTKAEVADAALPEVPTDALPQQPSPQAAKKEGRREERVAVAAQ